MIIVKQFSVSGFDSNLSYILYDEISKEAAVVDPAGDVSAMLKHVDEFALRVRGVILTHTHADHLDALDDVLLQYEVPVYVHAAGVSTVNALSVKPIEEDMELQLGEYDVSVLYTPGHSIDSICLYIDNEAAQARVPQLISGDTLFVEGCGRTHEDKVKALYDSLQMLKVLSPETVVYPGHDYGSTSTSTIGNELENNPYLKAGDFATFKKLRLS